MFISTSYLCNWTVSQKFEQRRLGLQIHEPERQKTNFRTCAPSEDSGQPAQSRSLIRFFFRSLFPKAKDATFLHAEKDSDQYARMSRLVRVFLCMSSSSCLLWSQSSSGCLLLSYMSKGTFSQVHVVHYKLSQPTTKPIRFLRPAKTQIRLRIRAV